MSDEIRMSGPQYGVKQETYNAAIAKLERYAAAHAALQRELERWRADFRIVQGVLADEQDVIRKLRADTAVTKATTAYMAGYHKRDDEVAALKKDVREAIKLLHNAGDYHAGMSLLCKIAGIEVKPLPSGKPIDMLQAAISASEETP